MGPWKCPTCRKRELGRKELRFVAYSLLSIKISSFETLTIKFLKVGGGELNETLGVGFSRLEECTMFFLDFWCIDFGLGNPCSVMGKSQKITQVKGSVGFA